MGNETVTFWGLVARNPSLDTVRHFCETDKATTVGIPIFNFPLLLTLAEIFPNAAMDISSLATPLWPVIEATEKRISCLSWQDNSALGRRGPYLPAGASQAIWLKDY